ncbi:Rne/Rng family ribonuclease [Arthrobacter sp. Helios]|uniref:Rne/Rng family ribonuclease n=1 Tax=Arthrobacter sp. Helios TaxID=2828862 RepID=UPI00206E9157|nr:Rne/Rng family ribonuclease [Arthrobacter sp. Helios]UPO78533.1 Rne/Rng family ribonuclease [Arthrobacter sp. Helios]
MNTERTTEEAVEAAPAAEAVPETVAAAPGAAGEPAAKAPVKRATRTRRKPAAASVTEPETPADPPAADTSSPEPVEKPKRTRAPRRKPAAETSPAAADTGATGAEAPAAAAEAVEAVPVEAAAADAAETAPAPAKAVRRRRTPVKKAVATAGADAPAAAAPDAPALDAAPAAGEAGAATPDSETTPGSDTPAPEAADPAEAPAKAAPRTRRRSTAKAGQPGKAEAPAAAAKTEETPAPAEAPDDDETAAAPVEAAAGEPAPAVEETSSALNPFAIPESATSVLFHAPDLTAVKPVVEARTDSDTEDSSDETDESRDGGRSRRSRRRSRGRSKPENEAGTEGEEGSETATADDNAEGVTSRRRRRRRRGDADLELTGGSDDDPPNTVTRVRAPRAHAEPPVNDRVTSVKGSTRLEAKKQRRRESRESGRRRHVITEAEFLARRESVDRQMIVRQRDDRIQIGVLEDGVLAEHFVSNTQQDSLIGNVYVGKVQNVLPSMEAAFVDIGRGRNAVLYAGEVNWDAAGLDGQPRRIELALKSGDSVLVQVTKDPVGHKGARLTSQISLPGRYLVYVPGGSMTGISRKLPDVERNRLKKILKDHLPQNAGVIVRTAAEGASEEELMNDINRLRAQWENIEAKAKSTKTLPPELLYGEPDLTIKVVRDVFNEDFSKLIVSGEEAWDTIEAYVTYVAPDLVGRLEKWTKDEDIFAASRIDEQIAKALDRKVFLPSGGSLVIDRTEAMTVVDVNTGKFTGSGGNLEETVTKNNLEAAEEVVRQLRLRDIGGIIVIDFIDMVLEANRDLVLRRLVECLGRDRTKHQVAEVTSLGLVQMTRKRMGTGLLEVFGENCEHCDGRGVITHDIPVEHRRSTSHSGHAVSDDNHQQHLKQEKQSRGERKRRNRNQNQAPQPQAAAPAEPAKVDEPQPEDAERAAKAEAARAALATIAAATAAAHDAEGTPEAGAAPAAAKDAPAAPEEKPLIKEPHDDVPEEAGAILRIQGETVVVPRRERRRPVRQEVQLTLESLTEAFNDVSPVASGETDAGKQAAAGSEPQDSARTTSAAGPAAAAAPGGGEAPQRPRRRRAARSPQGSADAQIIKAETAEPAAQGSTTAVSAQVPAKPRTEAAVPVILGVGVPASDL